MAICGDGGFMMNSQEMETAVRLELNITVLILQRRRLRHDPLEAGQHGLRGLGPDLRQSRFRQICRELRRAAATASTAPRCCPSCSQQCLDTPGVHLIDCPVDYADNDRILNKEIKELSAKI